jgi:hypothetical protein
MIYSTHAAETVIERFAHTYRDKDPGYRVMFVKKECSVQADILLRHIKEYYKI